MIARIAPLLGLRPEAETGQVASIVPVSGD
jgi:hypothetical protein